jgi:hypothetical protein
MHRRAFLAGMSLLPLDLTRAMAADVDEYANVHTVAVVSNFADKFSLTRIGALVFNNSEQSLPISDWGIDQAMPQMVAEVLSPRFTVKPLDDAAMRSAPKIGDYLRSLPPDNGIDAFIVMGPGVEINASGTNQTLHGLGMMRHDLILGGHDYEYYAFYSVIVLDGSLKKRLDHGSSRLSDGSRFLGYLPPFRHTDETNWADTAEALTDAQKQSLKEQMTQLTRDALPFALKSANLFATAPAK